MSAVVQLDTPDVWRATCLLRLMALDGALQESHIARLCEEAEGLEQWIARLNVCQILAVEPCPAAALEDALEFLEKCSRDSHHTIRAWAYSALATLPVGGETRARVASLIRGGRRDMAKCVQARFRCDRRLKVAR